MPPPELQGFRRRSFLGRLAALTAIALAPAIFLAVAGVPADAVGSFTIHSLLYSYVIGGLSYLALPYTWRLQDRMGAPWKWIYRPGVLVLTAGVGTLIVCLLRLAVGALHPEDFWFNYLTSVKVAILIALTAGSLLTFYEDMRSRLEANALERERALKLASEARLSSLESRIHPHFLFNTLNSISALIAEDPKRAERLIERMSELLRFSLDSNQHGLVRLESEIRIVRDYLEIEQARFGQRLRYAIDVAPALGEALVPPLSVQTLVENSVKFAIAPDRAGGEIRVAATQPNGLLHLTVADSGPGFDLQAVPAGHGIDNLRSRLQALFGGEARIAVDRTGRQTTVSLVIPQGRPR